MRTRRAGTKCQHNNQPFQETYPFESGRSRLESAYTTYRRQYGRKSRNSLGDIVTQTGRPGTVDKIDGLLEVLRPFGVLEMARTGRIAMTRGSDLLRPPIPVVKQPELEPAAGPRK